MYNVTTLKNGVVIATDFMPHVETVSVNIWVNVGSRYERKNQNGISHFLEHMAFKGTKKRNARIIAEEFDAIGGNSNAYTSREHTVYYAKVLKEDADKAFDILSDLVLNSTIDKDELERERGVIIQEIGQNFDTPDDVIFDYYQEIAFPEQPLGRSILGTPDLINSYGQDDIINYVNSYYKPDRIVISVAGNLKHDELVKLAERYFPYDAAHPVIETPKANYVGGEYREQRDLKQVNIILGFKGLSYHHEDFYTMQLLSYFLSSGMSSRLFQEIREKRGLAYTIQTYTSAYNDSGLLTIFAGTGEDQAKELTYVVCDELKKVCDNIPLDELQRAKVQMKSSILMDQESTGSRAEELGRNILCLGHSLTPTEVIRKIEAVTPDDLKRMMATILTADKPTIASLGAISDMPDYDSVIKRLSL